MYGAQKEGYQLKFDSLLLEALYRWWTCGAIGKNTFRRIRGAVQQIREVMRYIEEHYAKKLTVAQVASTLVIRRIIIEASETVPV